MHARAPFYLSVLKNSKTNRIRKKMTFRFVNGPNKDVGGA